MSTETLRTQPTRRGLLIGIDQYPLIPGANLSGCVHDAVNLARILCERFQFAREDLVMLLNEQATRDRILAELTALAQRTQPDDVVVVHYSGHGCQIPALDNSEVDGFNETLVAADSGRGALPNRDILDDELALLFAQIREKTAYLTVIFDCCHSGTGTRDVFGAKSRGLPPDLRAGAAAKAQHTRALSKNKATRFGYAYISGCRDEEKSLEHTEYLPEGVLHQGALSYFLQCELAAASGPLSVRTLFERVSRRVTQTYPSQHPQADGDLDHAVFGTEQLPPIEGVEIASRTDQRVVLNAGLVHGATAGSSYAVFASLDQLTADHQLGIIEIDRVAATTSSARILEERRPGAISAANWAKELRHALGDPGLTVELLPCVPDLSQNHRDLQSELARCTNVRVANDGSAHARIYTLGSRDHAAATDPVPQLGALKGPTWAVVERDGELMLPPIPTDAPQAAAQLALALSKLARKRALLLLENSSASSSLRGAVTCEVLTQRNGQWVTVAPDSSGQIPLEHGSSLAVQITNGSTQPIYPFLFYIGLEGSIDLLFPRDVRWEEWPPNRSLRIGTTEESRMDIELPADFPWHGSASSQTRVGGTGYLKLIATLRSVDLGAVLSQRSVVDDLRQAGVLADHRAVESSTITDALAGMLHGSRNVVVRSGFSESFETVTLPLFMYRPSSSASPSTTAAVSSPSGPFTQPLPDPDGFEISRGAVQEMQPEQLESTRDIAISSELPEYPEASFFAPAASSNYRRWTSSTPRSVSQIVIHITDGREKITGPISHFQKPGLQASAHYIVGRDGQVVQMVRHRDIAWHATTANSTSIGIEHCARSPRELGRDDPGLPVTLVQYQASARLVRFLCQQYGIPIDRAHIKGHCEAAKTTHEDCPNRIWDWGLYMSLLAAGGSPH